MKKIKNIIKNEIIISITFGLTIFVFLIVAQVFFIYEEYREEENNLKNKLILKGKTIETIIKNNFIDAKKENDYTLYKIINKGLENTIITKDNEIIINSFPLEIKQNILDELFVDNNFINYQDYKIYKKNYNNYIIYIINNINYSFSYFLNNLLFFIIIDLIIFLFAIIVGYLFIKKILKKLENNLKNLKEFTNDINHELKTPLSIIKSSLELYKKENGYNEYIFDSLNAINNITSSLSSISDIALYMENYNEKKEKIILKNEINNLIKIYKKEIENKNINIINNININTKININKNDLLICISNIIKNAIAYGKDNGNIKIDFNLNKITIKDNGIGISKQNINKIFNRFYSENNNYNNSNGIGLYITQKIIKKNGWKIIVKSIKGKKTIFIIQL